MIENSTPAQNANTSNRFVSEILSAIYSSNDLRGPDGLSFIGENELPSWFEVSDLAAASVGVAGLMAGHLLQNDKATIVVDKEQASLWFGTTIRPEGWELPSLWDPLAGDYETKDGWIRLHTNAPHHREAALSVLGQHSTRSNLADEVIKWGKNALEKAVVDANGCAAAMHDMESWQQHEQGKAVASEPLIHWETRENALNKNSDSRSRSYWEPRTNSLHGLKVLDLTRVLAGPVATRFLAAFGADVLRIDPPSWDEPGVVPEVTVGKRCAGLDLNRSSDRTIFEELIKSADVLVHGYRPGALSGLGYDSVFLHNTNPGLIDVSLNAYGWSGPWQNRRGFDSLVQMSSGIADYGMSMGRSDKPVPLPMQALDHATGYFLAACVLHALKHRTDHGLVLSAKLSLARTALLLQNNPREKIHANSIVKSDAMFETVPEQTGWGPAHRLQFPLTISGFQPRFDHPAGPLRTSKPQWA